MVTVKFVGPVWQDLAKISVEAQGTLRGLLSKDLRARLSATAALQSEWLAKAWQRFDTGNMGHCDMMARLSQLPPW